MKKAYTTSPPPRHYTCPCGLKDGRPAALALPLAVLTLLVLAALFFDAFYNAVRATCVVPSVGPEDTSIKEKFCDNSAFAAVTFIMIVLVMVLFTAIGAAIEAFDP